MDRFTDDIHTLFDARYREAIERLEEDYAESTYPEHLGLDIEWDDLADVNEDVAKMVLRSPDSGHDSLEEALREYDRTEKKLLQASVRVEELPEWATYTVGDARKGDINRLIGLEGQITKRTEVKPKLKEAAFECHRCGTLTYIPQGWSTIIEPHECQGCEMKGPWKLVESQSDWVDHQVVQLQQPPEDARGGVTASINAHLTEGLTDQIESGDRVTLNGVFKPVRVKNKTRHETVLLGRSVEIEETVSDEVNADESVDEVLELANSEDPYAELVNSIAPDHKGDVHLKEAMMLQLFSGWRRTSPSGSFHRGNIHMLWLGDPGTGKTGLMDAGEELAPRSAMTDGTGSSEAGLTASMTKDDFGDGDEWTIAAGTIVRASGGLAIVDEIDKGDVSDLDALHTALESQKVLVSKAGRHAHLDANTALLAAGNPTGGHFDPTEEFVDQIELKSPLLSRFDLIYTVREKNDDDLVREISRHMVDSRTAAGKHALGMELTDEEREQVEPGHDPELISQWIAYARENCHPLPTEEAKDRMVEYYTDLKVSLPERYDGAEEDDYDGPPLPVTARKQMALFRLAEASARIRLSDTITVDDVERVIPKVDRSLADIGIAPEGASLGEVRDDVDVAEVGV